MATRTHGRTHPLHGTRRTRLLRACAVAVAAAFALAACSSAATSEPTTPAGGAAQGTATGTTAVAGWGAIKDSVPSSFPLPPGTKPADLPGGPFSGAYTSTSSVPEAIVVVQQGLKSAGYPDATQSVATGDGNVTIDATGAGGCRIQVAIGPSNGLAAITVLYGASCP